MPQVACEFFQDSRSASNDLTHVGDGRSPEAQLRQTDALYGTWSDDSIRKDWSERETRRIVESDLKLVNASRTELTKLEFRRLARFMFAEFPAMRKRALLTGKITMGDGRVIRRANHVDMTEKAKTAA